MNDQSPEKQILEELRTLDPGLLPIFERRDAYSRLITQLPRRYPPAQVAKPPGNRMWELAGLYFLKSGRVPEALGIFWGLYQQMLKAQHGSKRVHKGMPLVWISDCFGQLRFPVYTKRYLMLTLCEDALRERGTVSPDTTGIYFRLVWGGGLTDGELKRYASHFYESAKKSPKEAIFPEALLQRTDNRWLTELPSPIEASSYWINSVYVQRLLTQLGRGRGEALELLAEYLMSCMPGCRTRRRERSRSTEYDIVCSMEGFDVDFRSELGRYFVCECKDWNKPADTTVMAKFCRILDSTKSRFGVLFSKSGISGTGKIEDAEWERKKVFYDRGIVIVVLTLSDLKMVSEGVNLIGMLRERYEAVRLDLPAKNRPSR